MRRYFIAGNWKMNLDRRQSVELAQQVVAGVKNLLQTVPQTVVETAICPPFAYLDAVAQVVANTPVGLGAQNVYHQPSGAFTGEVSVSMLRDVGCRYVIVGHSERRHILGESNQQVNQKVLSALAEGLAPIVCVGETLHEREARQTFDITASQLFGSLAGVTAQQMSDVVIAYEPVWAIGTGKTATPQQAEEVHADLRKLLESRYNSQVAQQVRIQYGGSVKPSNAEDLLQQPNIDGALVGGASLEAESFISIVRAVSGASSPNQP